MRNTRNIPHKFRYIRLLHLPDLFNSRVVHLLNVYWATDYRLVSAPTIKYRSDPQLTNGDDSPAVRKQAPIICNGVRLVRCGEMASTLAIEYSASMEQRKGESKDILEFFLDLV